MTDRLYYHDSFLASFRARVLLAEPAPPGFRIYLDRTAFYPDSGGQPSDRGTLGGLPVQEVGETEDGRVFHLTPGPLQGEVQGEIDFGRRFDHMQQHSGQHLLSAVWARLYRFKTVGFHLGDDLSTIDLESDRLTPAQLQHVLDEVNRTVWQDLPVTVSFHPAEEASTLGLRKPTGRTGEIRVIQIEGLDRSACGGTHVRSTGQIGLVAVPRTEKIRGTTRLHFICGARSWQAFQLHQSILDQLSNQTTTGLAELPARVEKLLQASRESEKEIGRLRNELLEKEIPELRARGRQPDGSCLVSLILDEPAPAARHLCQKLIAGENATFALVAARPDCTLFIGRSPALARDLHSLAGHLRDCLGLKGGGRPDFIQFGCQTPELLQHAMAAAHEWHRESGR